MKAFDSAFLEVAKRETRSVTATDHRGTPFTFVFRELYCEELRCDCRRVLIVVELIEGNRVAASINYAFQPRKAEPQLFLDPLNPQSELAETVFDIFAEMIATDREYRARLRRHYTMWKMAVDDPAHPQHAIARGPMHDDPSFGPAFPSRGKKPPSSTGLQRIGAKARGADTKLQRRFVRLIRKVEQLKQRVGSWRDASPGLRSELAEYVARVEAKATVARDMVGLLDRLHREGAYSKLERKKLRALVRRLAAHLIDAGHEDLKPVYDRHSPRGFDAEAAQQDAVGAEVLKAMMESFGVDLGDVDIDTVEQLKAVTDARLEEMERAEREAAARRAQRKKSPRQLASEARKEAEQRGASKAIQDVYRELARALHPDREPDVDERVRKTELMQQVNVAYERKDLLALLELQLRFERVDEGSAASIAEDRLRHYIKVLDDQVHQLDGELVELELPWHMTIDETPLEPLSPEHVRSRIRHDRALLEQEITALQFDLDAFKRDERSLKVFLRSYAAPRANIG